MPRFRPIALYTSFPSLTFPGGSGPGVSPRQIAERNPRRRLLYLRNNSGIASDVVVSGDLSAQEASGTVFTNEGQGIHIPDEAFGFAQDLNPTVLNYSGLAAAVGVGPGTYVFSVGELVDDVDHHIEEPLKFRSRFFSSNELVGQPGPDFQPIKIFETEPGLRFVQITAQAGDIAIVGQGTPFRLAQCFRIPTFSPALFFKHPFVPSRSIFAADVSGLGGRIRVVSGTV